MNAFSSTKWDAAREGDAFERAREILRKRDRMSWSEFEELDELFQEVSATDFVALTRDINHKRQLRRYELMSRWETLPYLLVFGSLFIASSIIGIVIVLTQ